MGEYLIIKKQKQISRFNIGELERSTVEQMCSTKCNHLISFFREIP
jgi:hypothetical protein